MKIAFAESATSKPAARAPAGADAPDSKLEPRTALVVTVAEDRVLGPAAAALDEAASGVLGRAMAASRFTGKRDQTLHILAPDLAGVSRIMLLGIGKPADLDTVRLEALGGTVWAQLGSAGEAEVAVDVGGFGDLAVPASEAAASIALGVLLRSYRFDRYRTKEKPEQKPSLKKLVLLTPAVAAARKAFATREKLANAIFFARDLVSEPANTLYPESFVAECQKLESLGLGVEVLDEKRMRKLGMGAILGVGQGSARPPRLVILSWEGGKEKEPPVVVIGKGITFDTGGISLKPGGGMEEMKYDMAGAATVVGLLHALAARKAKANVVGLAVLAENMPDGLAQRPGDVVTSMSGQTIEVINTDAEGRLVLADALWYAQDRFKPRYIVDLATLTGAILVALGHEYAGLFSNDEGLAAKLELAGRATGELLWRMPLNEVFDREIDSDIADMKNVANGRNAGSAVAAMFLQRFVNGTPWAHLDIAGTAWAKRDLPTVPKGATGFAIRLLDRFIGDLDES